MHTLELDLRDLPPPEPMQRILDAVDRRRAALLLQARTPFWPGPLLVHLENRGCDVEVVSEPDGTALLRVSADAPA